MHIHFLFAFILLMVACQPSQNKGEEETQVISPTKTRELVGVYKDATVYTGKTDYAFEVNGQTILVSISNFEEKDTPIIPSNLLEPNSNGIPGPNPLLIGAKYYLEYDADGRLKRISLFGPHDPSNVELPALPENYSGLLSEASSPNHRAYLNLSADLTAILLINYGDEDLPLVSYGRWTRTTDGSKIILLFNDKEPMEFLIKGRSLIHTGNEFGTAGLSILANGEKTICQYIRHVLANISAMDGQAGVPEDSINDFMPFRDFVRTEHGFMSLYGLLETSFQIPESTIASTLTEGATVQDVCDLAMHKIEGGGGH